MPDVLSLFGPSVVQRMIVFSSEVSASTSHSYLITVVRFDRQRGKRALIPYANGEGPDELAASVQSDLNVLCQHTVSIHSVSGQ